VKNGGEGGILTLGCLTTTSDFESAGFDRINILITS